MPDLRYRTGTCSVDANGEVVTFSSALMLSHAMIGDEISIDRRPKVDIVSVDGEMQLGIEPWDGPNLTGVPYVLFQNSVLRSTRGQTAIDNAQLNAAFKALGYVYYVPEEASGPDPSDGYDGQFAMKVSTRELWKKVSGVWIRWATQFIGFLAYTTLDSLNADLEHPQNTGANVYSDTPTNNGTYIKTGGIGAGSWVRLRGLTDKAELNAAFALLDAGSLPIASLLTRAADPVGTIRGASDVTPKAYFTKRRANAAAWSPSIVTDL